jgi:hypothetical protein
MLFRENDISHRRWGPQTPGFNAPCRGECSKEPWSLVGATVVIAPMSWDINPIVMAMYHIHTYSPSMMNDRYANPQFVAIIHRYVNPEPKKIRHSHKQGSSRVRTTTSAKTLLSALTPWLLSNHRPVVPWLIRATSTLQMSYLWGCVSPYLERNKLKDKWSTPYYLLVKKQSKINYQPTQSRWHCFLLTVSPFAMPRTGHRTSAVRAKPGRTLLGMGKIWGTVQLY